MKEVYDKIALYKFVNKLIQCNFVIDLFHTVNQWRRYTGLINTFRGIKPYSVGALKKKINKPSET